MVFLLQLLRLFNDKGEDNFTTLIVILGIVAILSYVAPKIYELCHAYFDRKKQIRKMLLELQHEIPSAYSRAVQYGSKPFFNSMVKLIEHYTETERPFKFFVPIVQDDKKFEIWSDLSADLPKYLHSHINRNIATSRLITAILLKIQTDEFAALTSTRQTTALAGLVQLNQELAVACEALQSFLTKYELYGERVWEDPDHLKPKR
jgi:hypothetical protein